MSVRVECSVRVFVVGITTGVSLSLALTNFLARLVLALYASLGVFLRNLLRMGMSVVMEVQCLRTILNAFLALGQ